jgi:hypothetical protein
MQGIVYGDRIIDADPCPGVDLFFAYCYAAKIASCIVNHKTKFPYLGPKYDLHDAGRRWLQTKGFLDTGKTGISIRQVYFELTKEEKIDRISALGCTHFIDDLPEILLANGIPFRTKKILFDPRGGFRDMRQCLPSGIMAEDFGNHRTGRGKAVKRTVIKPCSEDRVDILPVAERLAADMGLSGQIALERISGGRNNRIFRMTIDNRFFLLKSYFVHDGDRLGR